MTMLVKVQSRLTQIEFNGSNVFQTFAAATSAREELQLDLRL